MRRGVEAEWQAGGGDGDPALVDGDLYAGGDRPGRQVTYEAARVPNPDRIYFDLHGTRLAQELVGKSFAVTDDGFLKKIRAAQYSDDVTRVVLDVNDVTEYSAFLLPNPYRLIIDIHGARAGTGQGTGERPGAGTADGSRRECNGVTRRMCRLRVRPQR